MATTPENRFFTADIPIVALSVESNTYNTFDIPGGNNNNNNLVGLFNNVKLNFDVETDDATIPTDLFDANVMGFEYHVFKGSSWSMELGQVSEGTLDVDSFLYLALSAPTGGSATAHQLEIHRGLCKVSFMRPGKTGVFVAGTTPSYYTGLGWFSKANFKYADGLITQSATVTNFGPLNIV